MSLYSKPSRQLVYDLINQANPDLPYPVTPDNVSFGAPAVVAGAGSAINTEVIGRSRPNGQYVGKQSFRYLRLTLATLFRGMTVEVHKYSEALSGNTNTGTVMFTVHQLLADINAKFGLNLTTDDIVQGDITRGNTQNAQGRYTNTVTVNANSASLGWVGSFQLKWVEAPRSVDTMITVMDLTGRSYPGGNDFSGDHPTVLNSAAYGQDWTELAESLLKPKYADYPNPFADQAFTPAPSSERAFYLEVVAQLKNRYPGKLDGVQDNITAYGWRQELVSLPNARFPEANSVDYNRLLILTPPQGLGVVGQLLIHFSV